MRIQKEFALHYLTVKEIEALEKSLLSFGCDVCDYEISLEFDDDKIDTSSKEEFISIIQLKSVNPKDFMFIIYGKKVFKAKEKLSFEYSETIYTIILNAQMHVRQPALSVSVKAPEVDKAYSILSKIEEILNLQKIEKVDVVESKKEKSVFIAHSFDKKGRAYGQILGKFLTLLGFNVQSGEKYSPEPVDSKIKKRVSSQEILMIIYSPKLDYTWLHQEAGGGAFTNKPIFILRENGIKIKKGILRGREYIKFPSNNLEKTFIKIIEGLEEIGYW